MTKENNESNTQAPFATCGEGKGVRFLLFSLFCFFCLLSNAQDSTCLKVHFLYGSKPLKKYRGVEKKWFGGVLGGHVGLEVDSNRTVDFVPQGKFHLVTNNKNKHSKYTTHSINGFYGILGSNPDSVKKLVVYVPISRLQKEKFDSISTAYLKQSPYDYAFVGMRCGAATYEILGQLNILPTYSHRKTYAKIFYPKILREQLLAKASANGWKMERQEGSPRRKWEKD